MMTITEALAEIATIDKRLPKKLADMVPYVARPDQVRDPFERSGGSEKYLREERQSYQDLLRRKIELRAAVAKANAQTTLDVDGTTMTVADWLVWKRECYQATRDLLEGLIDQARRARQLAQQHGGAVLTKNASGETGDVVVSVDERALVADLDALTEHFGKLDGLLSLLNATTYID